MSTPPFLELPPGVEKVLVPGRRGGLAALAAGGAGADASERGPGPVLLVPGFTGSKEDFIAVLAPIAAAGHPVLAVDQRGQFESPGDEDPRSYDLTALAQDVLDLCDHLGRPVHLLGHSFGGLVARRVALTEPAALRSLTLLGSGPAAIPEPTAASLQLMVSALPVMDLESIWVAKRRLEAETEVVMPKPVVEDFMHRRFVAGSATGLLRQAEQLLAETDRVEELAAVDLPVLVAYGSDDDAWPAALQAEMARRLGARTAVIVGGGHSPAARCPTETVAALLGFWSSC